MKNIWSIIRNISILHCYALTETSNAEEKESFYEQHNMVQERLRKSDVVIMMGNAKAGSDNTLRQHVIGKHGLLDGNKKDEKFMTFCNFHRLATSDTLFEHGSVIRSVKIQLINNVHLNESTKTRSAIDLEVASWICAIREALTSPFAFIVRPHLLTRMESIDLE